MEKENNIKITLNSQTHDIDKPKQSRQRNNHNDKHNTQMQNLCKFEMIEIRNGNI